MNQTIEPSQVAGFNQIFDDPNGTKSRRLGIGFDTHYQNKLFSGFEVSSRDLAVPIFSAIGNNFNFENQSEKLYRTYLYSSFFSRWTMKGEIQFEKFSRAESNAGPHLIETLSVPLSINYFHPQGFFSNFTGTYARQEVNRKGEINEGIENFFTFDISLGYRLPNRNGLLSLEVRNLFDQSFLYRNQNFRVSEPVNSVFVPTRTIFARLTLNF